MGSSANEERRKYKRIATDHVISFAHVDTRDRLAVGKNLSTGGIRFEAVGCEISQGEHLRVTFNVGDHTVVATGHVKWAIEVDPFTLDIGLEFSDVDPIAMSLLEEATSGLE
ncbi:MAG: PilZ domain-containing protein [Deltaproteobacteria bacterium]|nr:PilZ domain-containing protein [Deltaproteobacteria bacterium]MBW2446022.1 PilZ domain-containing protein [Deltaproteobacteria bacterium]